MPDILSVAIHGRTIWLLVQPNTCPDGAKSCTGLWHSADGGHHWARVTVNVNNPPGGAPPLSAVVTADDRRVFVESDHGLLATSDGGLHFREALKQREPGAVAIVGNEVWVFEGCTAGSAPACRATVDAAPVGSTSWRRVAIPPGPWATMHVTNRSDVQLIDGETPRRSLAAVTRDSGRTWSVRALPCRSESLDVTLPRFGPGYLLCYLGGGAGNSWDRIYRSDDFGVTWKLVDDAPISGYPDHIAVIDGPKLVLIGGRMAAAVSADGGRTWHPTGPPGNATGAGDGYLADIGNAFVETGLIPRAPPAFSWSTDLREWSLASLPAS